MQGIMSHQKIEMRFWSNLPENKVFGTNVLADGYSMALIDQALTSKRVDALAQVLEIHKAWTNIRKSSKTGNVVS